MHKEFPLIEHDFHIKSFLIKLFPLYFLIELFLLVFNPSNKNHKNQAARAALMHLETGENLIIHFLLLYDALSCPNFERCGESSNEIHFSFLFSISCGFTFFYSW